MGCCGECDQGFDFDEIWIDFVVCIVQLFDVFDFQVVVVDVEDVGVYCIEQDVEFLYVRFICCVEQSCVILSEYCCKNCVFCFGYGWFVEKDFGVVQCLVVELQFFWFE